MYFNKTTNTFPKLDFWIPKFQNSEFSDLEHFEPDIPDLIKNLSNKFTPSQNWILRSEHGRAQAEHEQAQAEHEQARANFGNIRFSKRRAGYHSLCEGIYAGKFHPKIEFEDH